MFLARRLQQGGDWRIPVFAVFAFAMSFLIMDYTRDLIMVSLPLILLTAEWTVREELADRALSISWPFPLLFLLQAQFLQENRMIDTNWSTFLAP